MDSRVEVFEVKNSDAQLSREEIEALNRKNFPKSAAEDPETEKAAAADAAEKLLQKRIFAFSKTQKESSWEKVVEFRNRFAEIKLKIAEAKQRRAIHKPHTSRIIAELESLEEDAEVITSKEEGKIDSHLLLSKPNNIQLDQLVQHRADSRQAGKALVFEFVPDKNNTRRLLLSTIAGVENSVNQIELLVGRERKHGTYTFELKGYNMKSAVDFLKRELGSFSEGAKAEEKTYIAIKERWEKYANDLEKKINEEANKILDDIAKKLNLLQDDKIAGGMNLISLSFIKNVDSVFELYKGMLKYQKII